MNALEYRQHELRSLLVSLLRLVRCVLMRGGAPLVALRASDAHQAALAISALSGRLLALAGGGYYLYSRSKKSK
jgi:hypothetical protein